MKLFSFYKNDVDRKELFIRSVHKDDLWHIRNWIAFDKEYKVNCTGPERCNFLQWDVIINNLNYYNYKIFKIVSKSDEKEYMEGLICLSMDNTNSIVVEAIEVAPWNRTIYLGDNRFFRKIGTILIGFAILYGMSKKYCGIIKLESLATREEYYRSGLNMIEVRPGEFMYDAKDCQDFLEDIIQEELIVF